MRANELCVQCCNANAAILHSVYLLVLCIYLSVACSKVILVVIWIVMTTAVFLV